MSQKPKFNRKLILLLIISAVAAIAITFLLQLKKAEIKTTEIPGRGTFGTVVSGINSSTKLSHLKTSDELVYESTEIESPKPKSNAAILSWNQTDAAGEIITGFRIFNGEEWSEWVDSFSQDERKDGTPVPHNALILSDAIHKIQYRFEIFANNGISPEVNLETVNIELVDATKGPSPTKTSFIKSVLGKMGLVKRTSARGDGPRIYSRAEWGSPEPDGSPRWPPSYQPLYRAIVHHTAMTTTADSAAAIRAIWHYHANTNGWGDIGYNYLVDAGGNIFQGRYFDHDLANSLRRDVVGGHAYDNNSGTTGVAVLGDFSHVRPGDPMVDAVARVIGFKAADYYFNPSGIGPNGPNVIGHRDVYPTVCPGGPLYERLQEIRNVGDIYYSARAAINRLDLTNQGQGYEDNFAFDVTMQAGETRHAYFDLRNEGDYAWGNYGVYPTVLGTDQQRDRASLFATTGSWLNAARVGSFSHKVVTQPDGIKELEETDTILPGEVGRFSFTVTAPELGGLHREHFQLLIEGREWFSRNLLLSTNIHVIPRIYSWQPIAQHIFTDDQQTTSASTTDLNPGQRVYLVIKAKNTGNQTWYIDGAYPARVATSSPRDRLSVFCDTTWLNCGRPGGLEESSVSPDEVGTFGFWIKVPDNSPALDTNEYFSLVVENKVWANTEPGIYWPISVRSQ